MGLYSKIIFILRRRVRNFLKLYSNEIKSEYLIPTVINDLIEKDKERLRVLKSNSSWFGVTYKKDKPYVQSQILELINAGSYPSKLF